MAEPEAVAVAELLAVAEAVAEAKPGPEPGPVLSPPETASPPGGAVDPALPGGSTKAQVPLAQSSGVLARTRNALVPSIWTTGSGGPLARQATDVPDAPNVLSALALVAAEGGAPGHGTSDTSTPSKTPLAGGDASWAPPATAPVPTEPVPKAPAVGALPASGVADPGCDPGPSDPAPSGPGHCSSGPRHGVTGPSGGWGTGETPLTEMGCGAGSPRLWPWGGRAPLGPQGRRPLRLELHVPCASSQVR